MAISLNKYLVSYVEFDKKVKDYKSNITWNEYNLKNVGESIGKFIETGAQEFKADLGRSFIHTKDIIDTNVYIRFWIKFESSFSTTGCILNYKDIIGLYYNRIENYINKEKNPFTITLDLNIWYLIRLQLNYSENIFNYKLSIDDEKQTLMTINTSYDSFKYIDKIKQPVKFGITAESTMHFYTDEFAIFKDIEENKFDFNKYSYKNVNLLTVLNQEFSDENKEEEEEKHSLNDYLVSSLDFENNYEDYKGNIYWIRHNSKYLSLSNDIGKFGNALYVNKAKENDDTYLISNDIQDSSVYISFWLYLIEKNPDICIFNFKDIVKVYCNRIEAFDEIYKFSSDLNITNWYLFKINITYTNMVKFINYNIESGNLNDVNNSIILEPTLLHSIVSNINNQNPDISNKSVKIGGIGKGTIKYYIDEISIFKDINEDKFNFNKYINKQSILANLLEKEERETSGNITKDILKNSLLSHIDFDKTFVDYITNITWKSVNVNQNNISNKIVKFNNTFHLMTDNSKQYIFTNSISDTQVFVRFWLYLEYIDPTVCIFNFKDIIKVYYNRIESTVLNPTELYLDKKCWYLAEIKIDYTQEMFMYNVNFIKESDILHKQSIENNGISKSNTKSSVYIAKNVKLPTMTMNPIKLGATTEGKANFYIDDFSIFNKFENLADISFELDNSLSIRNMLKENTANDISNVSEYLDDYLISYLNFDKDYSDYKNDIKWTMHNPLSSYTSEFMGKFDGSQYFESRGDKESYLYTDDIPNTDVKIRFWVYFEDIDPDICILDYKGILKVYCNRIESKYNGKYGTFDLQLEKWHYFEIDLKYKSNYCSFTANVKNGNIYSAEESIIQNTITDLPSIYITKDEIKLPDISKEIVEFGILNAGNARFYIDEFAIFNNSQEDVFNISDYITKDTKLSNIFIKEKYEDTKTDIIGTMDDYLISYLEFDEEYDDYKSNINWKHYNSPCYNISTEKYRFTSSNYTKVNNEISYLYTNDIKDTNVYIRFWVYFETMDTEVCIFNFKDIIKVYCNKIKGINKECEFSPELKLNSWYLFKINLHYSPKSLIWSCYIFNNEASDVLTHDQREQDELYIAETLMNEVFFPKSSILPDKYNAQVKLGATTKGNTSFYIDEFAIFKDYPNKGFPYENYIKKDINLGFILDKEAKTLHITKNTPNLSLNTSKYVKSHLPFNENITTDVYNNKWEIYGNKEIFHIEPDDILHITYNNLNTGILRTNDVTSSNFTIGYWLNMNFNKTSTDMRYLHISNFLEVYSTGFIFHLPDWSSLNENNFSTSHYIRFNRKAFQNNKWVYVCIYLKLDVENKKYELAYKITDINNNQLSANYFSISRPEYDFKQRYVKSISIGMTNNIPGDLYIKDFQYTTDEDQYKITKNDIPKEFDKDPVSIQRISGRGNVNIIKTIKIKSLIERDITKTKQIKIVQNDYKVNIPVHRIIRKESESAKIFYIKMI